VVRRTSKTTAPVGPALPVMVSERKGEHCEG
jgi:hypothetical protein